jgi:uncharacterized Ntn-hydrolase superfamily protein
MTFSIVGRSADGQAWGVAVASKFLAVGSAVLANLSYRPEGLRLMGKGRTAQDTLDHLTGADAQREQRQAGVVDRDGRSATFTGSGCHAWAGGRTGPGYAVQGNILTGEEVVQAMEQAWLDGDPQVSLARRLLAALTAGDGAGGDRRGRQSAAVLVARRGAGYRGESDIEVDLRVDDHAAPVPELQRLLMLHELYFTKPDPATLLDLSGAVDREVGARLEALGHPTLDSWAGVENYEERMVAGKVDPLVLEKLREATPDVTVEPGP